MPHPPGRPVVACTAIGAVAILVLGGITQWDGIRERWYLGQKDSEDPQRRYGALLELMALRSDQAAPLVCELFLGHRLRGDVWSPKPPLPPSWASQKGILSRAQELQMQAFGQFQKAGYLAPHLVRIFSTEEPSWRWIRALRVLSAWKAVSEQKQAILSGLPRIETALAVPQGAQWRATLLEMRNELQVRLDALEGNDTSAARPDETSPARHRG